jgi:replicative DNA helicase
LNIQDPKLELQFISSLADLSQYDMHEAKKFIEMRGVNESDFERADHWTAYCGVANCITSGVPATSDNLVREISNLFPGQGIVLAKAIGSGDGHGSYVDGYCDKLLEISERRQTVRLLEDAQKRILTGSQSSSEIKFRLSNSLVRTRGRKSTRGLNEYCQEVEQHIQDVADDKIKPVTPWYIPAIDREIGGLQRTLTLIGAEPGVGKSALIVSGVNLQAANNHRPLVACLEDPPDFIAWRVMSFDSKTNQFDLRFVKLGNGKIATIREINKKQEEVRKRIRTIDGSTNPMKIEDLISSITDSIVNEGCDSVWIDHLGEIMLSNNERADLEIARHLSLLRAVANKHSVPVLVAAHFKRPADPNIPPSFRDFANSSGAERKARVALGLRRSPGSDILSVHVMKQTNGPAGQVIDLAFGGSAAMIVETEGGFR